MKNREKTHEIFVGNFIKHHSGQSPAGFHRFWRGTSHVGGMLDLGAVLKIRDKKMGPGWDPTQNMIYGPEKCVESVAMMIYYCQSAGCSLSSLNRCPGNGKSS